MTPTARIARSLLTGLVVLSVMVPALTVPAVSAAAESNDPWLFEGGGWGHGVGLSQFGALGQAEDGRSVEQILTHYYSGTSLDTMSSSHWTRQADGLWVGLVGDTTSVSVEAVNAPLTICQPAPGCGHVSQQINPGESWKFEVNKDDSTQCRLRHVGVTNTGYDQCNATITELSPTKRVKLNGKQYARGALRFDPSANGFHAVVTLELETYLYGLAEVPSSWPAAALQAQAVIGRSYAVATAIDRGGSNGLSKLSSCGCHLRSTTADQAYAGWSKEDPANSGAQWVSAVNATDRDILTHPQSTAPMKVAKTFYSSSNGGASENVEDVWGGSALPWLRSVNDQWSSDPSVNPLARWSVKVSDSKMAAALGWDRALDASVLQGPPDVLVEFTGIDGGADVKKVLNGTQIASLLNVHGFGYQAVGSTSTQVRVSPYIIAVSDPPGFDDIVGHLFEADIEWALENDVTKGCNPPDNTLYCPDSSVTRGQMAAFLARHLDLPASPEDHFVDDNSSIFEDDINRLAAAGITKGCNPPANDRFCPSETVDRGQMAAFLVRAFHLDDPGAGDLFTDDDSSIFEADIDRLGNAGITRGCNPPVNDRFCHRLDVDRGAMAAFLHRAGNP